MSAPKGVRQFVRGDEYEGQARPLSPILHRAQARNLKFDTSRTHVAHRAASVTSSERAPEVQTAYQRSNWGWLDDSVLDDTTVTSSESGKELERRDARELHATNIEHHPHPGHDFHFTKFGYQQSLDQPGPARHSPTGCTQPHVSKIINRIDAVKNSRHSSFETPSEDRYQSRAGRPSQGSHQSSQSFASQSPTMDKQLRRDREQQDKHAKFVPSVVSEHRETSPSLSNSQSLGKRGYDVHLDDDHAQDYLNRDYTDAELLTKPYSSLAQESFDQVPLRSVPRLQDLPPELDEDSLTCGDKINMCLERYPSRPEIASDVLYSLFWRMSQDEWDQAGDWMLDQFAETIKSLKDFRQRKRHLCAHYEAKIQAKDAVIGAARTALEKDLDEMRKQGMNLVSLSKP